MSDMKTMRFPVADNPGHDSVQMMTLDSRLISTHTVSSSLSSHVCDPSTDGVLINVQGDEGILVGNGPIDDLTDGSMFFLFAGTHAWALPPDRKTIHWKAVGADVLVKIQEGI